ncbi:unnamed protein product, partial [marine sediment metagenome]
MARVSGLDIAVIWTYLPGLMALMLVLAFYTLAAELLPNRWWALAATLAQFAVFMELDFRTSPYPNVMTKALLWVGLAAALRYAWRGDKWGLAVAGTVAFALASVHIFAIELYLISLAAYAAVAVLLAYWRRHFLD